MQLSGPAMKATFSEYYKLSDDELKALWGKSLFVIDANVLINLYRYPISARDDLFKALSAVGERLWMPFQAAYEYQRRRLDVIDEQKRAFEGVKNDLDGALKKVNSAFSARHPLIAPGTLLEDLKMRVDEYVAQLESLSDKQPDVHHNDEIRDKIDALLAGKVGPEPTGQDVQRICKDGEDRFLKKIPPGFLDGKKEDRFHFRGIEYSAKYGDLLIWNQTLDKAKVDGWKSLIFITDDKKEDWWLKVSGKIIGPLPALKAEIRKVGVEDFHMYTTENFLSFSSLFDKADIAPSSIEQVSKLNEAVNRGATIYIDHADDNGDSYMIILNDRVTDTARSDIKNKIWAISKNIVSSNRLRLQDKGRDFEIVTGDRDYNFDLPSRILSVPGVADVVPSNYYYDRISEIRRARVADDDLDLSEETRFYEMTIVIQNDGDAGAIQIANWIKMRLERELTAMGFPGIKMFRADVTSEKMHVEFNVKLGRRAIRYLRHMVASLEGVRDVSVMTLI